MTQYTVVTSMKDEGPYLLEWVAYHRGIGFTDIVIAANDCSDGTDKMLERLQQLGIVHYLPNFVPLGGRPHSLALKLADGHPAVRGADFALVIDADEFLIVKSGTRTVSELADTLARNDADAMLVSWRLIGSSGQSKYKDRPVLERFTTGSDSQKRQGVKTFFRMSDDLRLAIHFPKPRKPGHKGPRRKHRFIDASGREIDAKAMSWNGVKGVPGRDVAEIAHFMIKSSEEYLTKIFRGDGLVNSSRHGLGYWRSADQNGHSDLDLSQAAAVARREMSKLLKDEVLADLHERSVRHRKQSIGRIKSDDRVVSFEKVLRKASRNELEPGDELLAAQITQELSPKLIDKSRVEVRATDRRAWMDRREIRVNWFRRAGGTGRNFGDDLGPFLVSKILKRPVEYASIADADIVAIGSVLQQTSKAMFKARRSDYLYVWGAGLIEDKEVNLQPTLKLLAVRGVKTARNIGMDTDSICLGDPGILAPRFIDALPKASKMGFVPHYTQRRSKELQQWAKAAGALWIDPTGGVEDVVGKISSCESIVSSSLHGLIVADSYGIPNCWMNKSGHRGYDFKFADYASGVGRQDFTQIDMDGLIAGETPTFSVAGDLRPAQDRLIHALERAFQPDVVT